MPKHCPSCQQPMELGELSLGRTALGWLFSRGSFPHLFFYSKKHERTSVLNWKSSDPPAWRCAACGTVVFLGNKGK